MVGLFSSCRLICGGRVWSRESPIGLDFGHMVETGHKNTKSQATVKMWDLQRHITVRSDNGPKWPIESQEEEVYYMLRANLELVEVVLKRTAVFLQKF